MDNKFMTREELEADVKSHLKSCDIKDLKCFYSYFHGFDDFHIIVDEAAPGYKVWAGGEEVPF